jgi:hypothetical protein
VDPFFNEVIPMFGPEGDLVPLRWQVNGNEVTVTAEPDKGDPLEAAALEEINDLVDVLTPLGIRHVTLKRNTPAGDRIDAIRIPRDQVGEKLLPFLPDAVREALRS